MLCSNPSKVGGQEYACGKCAPCVLRRRRLWAARLMLESYSHNASSFITLTYSDSYLPADMQVSVRELQLFMKRLRKELEPRQVRYFGVGEYGSEKGRPHYHVALFGYNSPCPGKDYPVLPFLHKNFCCPLSSSWIKGTVHSVFLTPGLCYYLVGYLVGKSEGSFARMSLRPGIGAPSLEEFARSYATRSGNAGLLAAGDVISSYRVGGRLLPIGRYLKRLLRVYCGMEPGEPAAVAASRRQELAALLMVPDGRQLLRARREVSGIRAERVVERILNRKGKV